MNSKSVNVLLNRKLRGAKNFKKQKSKLDLESITTEKVIEILNKHQEKSLQEIAILKHFILNKTKIINKFSNDMLDESSYDLLLSLSLPSSTYKNIKNENHQIINIGDPAEYLFIILKGKAAIYNMERNHKEMSGYEYYLLLQNYKINNENYLLEKTISENNLVFPIETEDIYILDKIVLKIFLNKQEKRILPNYLDLLIERVGLKYSDFKLESYIDKIERRNKSIIQGMNIENMTLEEKIYEYKKIMIYSIRDAWNVAFRNEKKILEELNQIDIEVIKKYIFLTKTTNEESITFYKCVYTKTIENNDYFGDSEHKIYINKVISLSNNLELFCIKTDLYNEFVRRIKSKLLGNQINFLLDNFFFRSIYKNYFEKYYFKFFDLIEYKMKQIIVKENEPIKFCYFIKSGNVKLTSNRSILENHILIELIKNIILKSGQNNSKFIVNKALKDIYSEIKNNNIEYLNDEIHIKNNIHIMNLEEKNCIGSGSYYYGFNYLYTAEANSDVVEVYRISADKLMKMLKDKNHRAFYYYKKYCEHSLKMFFERLIKLNDITLINMKKNKIRQFGDIYNFEIENFEEKMNKNEKKLNNIVDKLKFFNPNIIHYDNADSNSFVEKDDNENENDKHNIINNNENKKNINIDSNLFLTQNPQTPFFKKINSHTFINLRKKPESVKNLNVNEHYFGNQNNKILRNMNKNKSFNLFPSSTKDSKKDLTSYIKVFDYKENLQKQENREELRAKDALIRLEKAERNEIQKLKKENKTFQNFFKKTLGDKRSFVMPLVFKRNSDKKIEENDSKNNNSNNNILEFYQRNAFIKNRMLMTSLYKNRFSEFFDKKFGPSNFNYDMSKTFLVNKKRFEYSIFDKSYINKNKNKSRNLSQKSRKYTNISEMKKLNSMKHFHLNKK